MAEIRDGSMPAMRTGLPPAIRSTILVDTRMRVAERRAGCGLAFLAAPACDGGWALAVKRFMQVLLGLVICAGFRWRPGVAGRPGGRNRPKTG